MLNVERVKTKELVEKFDMKMVPQANTIGPKIGSVLRIRMLIFFSEFFFQPRRVRAGSSGIRSIPTCRLANCRARIAIRAMRRKSEGWNVTPKIGTLSQREASFRFTPTKKVINIKSSAAMNTIESSFGRA